MAAPSDGRVALTWDDPNDDTITKYQYSTDYTINGNGSNGGATFSDISGSDKNTTAFTVTGLDNGTTYTLAVRAVNASGDGAASTATAVMVPAEPAGLSGIALDSEVMLGWDDPNNSTITEYQLLQNVPRKLTAGTTGRNDDFFGTAVAVDGNTALVGALQAYDADFNLRPGAVYLFTRDSEGAWSQRAKLTASDAMNGDGFGRSVALDGDTAVVGAYEDDEGESGEGQVTNTGSVYVFTKSAGGWTTDTETAKLTAYDAAEGDQFGNSVAVDGDTIVVGAYLDDDDGEESGSVYVFTKPSSDDGWNDWNGLDANAKANLTTKLTAYDAAEGDQFGNSVAVDGDTIVVGAYLDDDESGSVYAITMPLSDANTDGSTDWEDWDSLDADGKASLTAKLTPSDAAGGDEFGISVAIDGDTIVVGAHKRNDKSGAVTNSGAAYVFTKPGSVWATGTETAKLTTSDRASDDEFGISVALSGDTVVIGAHNDDDKGDKSGSTYFFTKPAAGWDTTAESAKVIDHDGAANDRYGYSVAVDGDIIVVGAYGDEGNQGAAHIVGIPSWTHIFDIAVGEANPTSYTVTGLTNAVEYIFQLRAVNDSGHSPASDTLAATPMPAPDAPANLSATVGDGEVALRWDNLNDDTITKYQYSTDYIINGGGNGNNGSATFNEISDSDKNTTAFTVTGLNNGTTYTIAVRAVNPSGAGAVSTATVVMMPAAPANFLAAPGDERVDLSWDDPSNNTIDKYQLLQLELAKLTGFGGSEEDSIGSDVAIDGDTAVVGAPGDSSARGAAYVFARVSGAWTIQATLTASVRGGSDFFGSSVAVSGDTVVIGATGDDDKGSGSGSVYVFTKPVGGWAADDYSGNETAKLLASDGANDDNFGRSVAVDGDTVAVGALRDDDKGSNSGSAYVFTKPSGGWSAWNDLPDNDDEMDEDKNRLSAKLLASDGAADDQFGISVAMDRDTVVVGSHGANGLRGKAYVFTKPVGGWVNGNETARLTASDRRDGDQFGLSVAIDADTVVVGAIGDDDKGSRSGSVYVFTKPSSNEGWNDWNGLDANAKANLTTKLTASDGAEYDWFGRTVAVDGNIALIGAPTDTIRRTDFGSAYLFTKTSGTWSETAKLNAPDAVARDRFGWSAALDGSTALVGAVYAFSEGAQYVGGAYVFDIADWDDISSSGPTTTSHTVTGLANYQEYRFVTRAVNGTGTGKASATVSATPRLPKPAKPTGLSAEAGDTEVRLGWADPDDSTIDKYQITEVIPEDFLTATGGAAGAHFGISVAIDGDTAVVGADRTDSKKGSAYIYTRDSNGAWTQQVKLDGENTGDQFGWSVAVDGDTVIVGAHAYDGEDTNDTTLENSGATYVFTKPTGGWGAWDDLSSTAKAALTAKLNPTVPEAFAFFGGSVALDGNTLAIGSRLYDAGGYFSAGAAYVFTKSGSTWSQQAKLTASIPLQLAYLGYSLAVDGDTVLAGAYGDDTVRGELGSGSAYVFDKPSGGWTDGNETAKLTASDRQPSGYFGFSVALDGDTAVIGASQHNDPITGAGSGAAYVFTRQTGVWGEKARLTPSDAAARDNFGVSVAVEDGTVVVGSWQDDDNGRNSGSAYVFEKPALGWAGTFETLKLTAPDGAVNDRFGWSVDVDVDAVRGDLALVGAYSDDHDVNGDDAVEINAGSVYVLGIPDWNDIDGSGSDTTTHTETGLTNGDEYTFQIRALNRSGAGPASDAASSTPMPKPMKPTWETRMASDSGDTQVRLRWQDPQDPSIIYYQYQQREGNDDFGQWKRVPESVATTTEYTVTGLENGTQYVFKIRAVNDIGAGPPSDELGLTPQDSMPDKPTGLSAMPGDTQVRLAWLDPRDRSIDKYQYQWTGADGSSEDWIEIPQGPGGAVAHQFTVTGLTNGVEYTFQIRAVDTLAPLDLEDDQFSDESDGATATPEGTPPAKPANLKAQAGDMQVELSWNDPDDSSIDRYRYSIDGVTDSAGISADATMHITFGLTGGAPLINGTEYTFRVWAENESGAGDASTVRAKPLPPEPDPPADLTAAVGDSLVKLTWEDPADSSIQKYEILHLLQARTLTGEDNDNFGYSVAVDGDIAVIGVYRDDDNGDDSGAVYVYTRTSGVWDEGVRLIASDGAAYDNFGISVAVDGSTNTVVVGASGDDDTGTDSGSAYVFVRPAGGWSDPITETAKLTAPDGESLDYFGISVAVDGDSVLVGAYGDDEEASDLEDSGSAYMFTRPTSAGGWSDSITQTAKLTASDRSDDDNFGIVVAVDSGTAVIGSPGDDDNGIESGSAYIFVKPSGGWIDAGETAKLTAPDGEAGDSFGYSVAVDGNTVVVGAHQDDDNGDDSGSTYIFTKPTGAGGWTRWAGLSGVAKDGSTDKLIASDGEAGDSFGYSVAVDIDTAEVNGSQLELATVLIGAYRDDDSGDDSGSAYVFSRDSATGVWNETNKLTAPNGEAGDWFGYSVAVDTEAHIALVGAGSAHMLDIHDWAEIPNSGAQTTDHLVTDLTNSQTYDFMVRAVNIAGEGPAADESATPEANANIDPEFGADAITLLVAENTPEGEAVGDPVTATDPDDVMLTYSLTGDDETSFEIGTTGQITVAEGTTLDYEGGPRSYSVTVSVHDGRDEDGTADNSVDDSIDVTIEVYNVDEVPILIGQSEVSYPEIVVDRVGTEVGTYEASDPEGETIQWSLSGEDAADFSINIDKGVLSLSFVSDPDFESPVDDDGDNVYGITVEASDGTTAATTLGVTVAVTNVDEDGKISLDEVEPRVGTKITVSLTDPDDGVNSVTWTWATSSSPTMGWSQAAATSSNSYTPVAADAGYYLRAWASYSDGQGDGKSAFTVSPRVLNRDATNGYPFFNHDGIVMLSVPENTRAGVSVGSVTATDMDNDRLTFSLAGGGSDDSRFDLVPSETGTSTVEIVVGEGTILDYESDTKSYSVTIMVHDGEDQFGKEDDTTDDSIEVTINVADVNEAPVINGPDSVEVDYPENSTSAVAAFTATDPDEEATIHWSLGGEDADYFSIDTDGVVNFKFSPNYESATTTYSVVVSVDDGKDAEGNSSTTTDDSIEVTINVTDVNEAPVIDGPDSVDVDYPENSTGPVKSFTASDPDTEDTIHWSFGGEDADHFLISTSGELSFEFSPNYESATTTYSVVVSVHDGKNQNGDPDDKVDASVYVTIEVKDVNEAPVFSSSALQSVAENTTVVVTVAASDPDEAETLTPTAYAITDGADRALFRIDPSTGALSFKRSPDFETPLDVESTAPQDEAGNNVYVVKVTATSGAGDREITVEQIVIVTVTNADDAGVVTLSAITPFEGLRLSASLSDQDGGVRGEDWQWQRGIDQYPKGGWLRSWPNISGANASTYTVTDRDVGRLLRASASYTDGSDLSTRKSAVSDATAAVSKTAEPDLVVNFDGASYTAVEGGEPATVRITLNRAATQDVVVPITGTANGDANYTVEGLSGGTLYVTIFANQDWATFTVQANTDQNTVDESVTFQFGTLPSNVVAVSQLFTVVNLDDAGGSLFDDSGSTDEEVPISIPVLENDSAELIPSEAVVTVVRGPEHGDLKVDGGTVTYKPHLNFNGVDSFTYTVGSSLETATVVVRVGPVNDAPHLVGTIEKQTILGQDLNGVLDLREVEVDIGDKFRDVDNTRDELTCTAVSSNSEVVLASCEDSAKVTVSPQNVGSATVTVTVEDLGGLSAVQTFEVVVSAAPGQPDRPVVTASGQSSIRVTWNTPSNLGGAIVDYDVRYRVAGRGVYIDAGYDGTGTSTTIRRLRSGTRYEVQVRAANAYSVGPWSDPGRGVTRESESRQSVGTGTAGAAPTPTAVPTPELTPTPTVVAVPTPTPLPDIQVGDATAPPGLLLLIGLAGGLLVFAGTRVFRGRRSNSQI